MNEIRTPLAGHAFFAGFEDRLLDTLAAMSSAVEYPTGTWIARTGGAADRFLAVTGGRAGIEVLGPGVTPTLVATAHAGEVIGWSWFVEPHRWRFDVLALDHVQALAIDAARLRAACAADHELGYQIACRLTGVMASRLTATFHQLVDMYGPTR
jgi:CRP-like cAMP-binding protein